MLNVQHLPFYSVKSLMIKTQQATQYLQQLEQQYPQAFKRNFLLYGQLKAKGLLDELKEFIPWILAMMIFVSTAFALSSLVESSFPRFDQTQAFGIAILCIMLFLMLTTPLIIKQMKHSSTHLYQQLSNTPMKLAVLIVLQTLNIAYLDSSLLQGLLFFFALSFGFIKFYKENMFRESTSNIDYYNLQQIRRVCFWSYKQVIKTKLRLKLSKKNTDQYEALQQKLIKDLDFHLELLKYENKMSQFYKFVDLDEYVDHML